MVANTAKKLRKLLSASKRSRSSLVNDGNVNEGTIEFIWESPPSGLIRSCFYLTRWSESPPLTRIHKPWMASFCFRRVWGRREQLGKAACSRHGAKPSGNVVFDFGRLDS